MDLEDLLKGKHHQHGNRHHDENDHERYRDDHHEDHAYERGDRQYYGGHRHGRYKLEMLRSLLHSLPHKKALLAGAIILGVFVLIIGIALLWALFPLLIKLAGYVEANGIQGVLDTLLSMAQLLWKGNG